MTSEEFNEKWKEFIEPGFQGQGLEFDIPEATKYLDEMVFPFLVTLPGFCYSQIKSKFGTSRFYARIDNTDNDAMREWFYVICSKVEKELNKWLWLEQQLHNRKPLPEPKEAE